MEESIKIYNGSLITIKHLAAILNEKNIPSRIQNNMDSGRLAGFGTQENDVDLFVQNSDIEKAQEILEEFRKK